MKKFLIILSFILPTICLAEEQERSLMYEITPDNQNNLTTMPQQQPQSRGDKCQQMSKEIDQLKGKPQRRHTLMQRYQQECELY